MMRDTPDRLYGKLFAAVQAARALGDSKTFVDAAANHPPAEILAAFRAGRKLPGFDLGDFVKAHFTLPPEPGDAATDGTAAHRPSGGRRGLLGGRRGGLPVEEHIEQLWDALTREADAAVEYSSLIPLPNRYVVPGGRFREVYYWDSYFTMLGLAECGRVDLIRNMADNFAYLIDEFGFVPNGNRTYYCTRSQPPFFALMAELLADAAAKEEVPSARATRDAVYARYLPRMKREYAFWMAGADELSAAAPTHRRAVLAPGGVLNRYWDDAATPRQESYAEDVELAAACGSAGGAEQLYRDIRAGAESGWDYSSRWFADGRAMASIRTTQILPVDLNALLFNLESTIARFSEALGDEAAARAFAHRAEARKTLLRELFFDSGTGMFVDLALPDFIPTGVPSLAAAYPLFFGIAAEAQAARVCQRIHGDFLKPGGWAATNNKTGQQWDSPNGWAPLQWIAYAGLGRYGFREEARTGAERWARNCIAAYRRQGCLMEKYDVISPGRAGRGGEYAAQTGFGWTNGVLLRLLREL